MGREAHSGGTYIPKPPCAGGPARHDHRRLGRELEPFGTRAVIYRFRAHSYRELPLRMAELGPMYRSELSGVLGGLTRVRAIQLNDAHIFCTLDQVREEAAGALELIRRVYEAMGIEPARYRLSLPGPGGKYMDAPELWRRSVALLSEVLDASGLPYESAEGEAAFHGPKIDVQVAEGAGRESTLSTVQIDFHQPERFDLSYIGADSAKHRPVLVHRSVVGSDKRAVAHLLEAHRGAFPGWLAPVQLVALPIAESERPAAEALAAHCVERGLRDGRRLAPLATEEAVRRIEDIVGSYGTALWDAL
ncbi:aminoacyl--tRNA ligase-related protein [Streptomyces sp. NPDC058579]|uniref:aminoacyl--tRNA ligase-related protein n=1 Tax=Streptomyces sp. NPDC058579 TaxID=3346548 RepID=UPI00366709BD